MTPAETFSETEMTRFGLAQKVALETATGHEEKIINTHLTFWQGRIGGIKHCLEKHPKTTKMPH
jgi:hypothetical protein